VWTLEVQATFSAAHFLPNHPKCGDMHGHNYTVCVVVAANGLDWSGMMIDFGTLKALVQDAIGAWDHRCLNELAEFKDTPPTAEIMASLVFMKLRRRTSDWQEIWIQSVAIEETPGCIATYYGDTIHGEVKDVQPRA